MGNRIFTSESVTEGHPDKICDQVSDAILDAILQQDPFARVACETAVTTGLVLVMGEITTNCYVDIEAIVRKTIRDIGYTRAKYGFDADTCGVIVSLNNQSEDIARGVDVSLEKKSGITNSENTLGAGDQGMMFGYACDETKELMPMGIALAHKICKRLSKVRKENILDYIRPDGKAQVSVEYENDRVKRVDTIVVSTQHAPHVSTEQIQNDIIRYVIEPSVPKELLDRQTKYYINPTGRFVIGGPLGDSGLTGRKIIVDTYGGYASHGGGAFSGKDPTKVDRSASYAARYVAKNIVAAGLAKRCQIELAYAIGIAQPVAIFVESFQSSHLSDKTLEEIIRKHFDLRPQAIIDHLQLRRPIYQQTAAYGHFGREDISLPWEKTDRIEELKRYL